MADKAVLLLSSFRLGDGPVTLAELAQRTGLHKSTILRVAASLEAGNLLVKLPVGGFRLGGQVLALAAIFREGVQLDREVRPQLLALAQETGESASFFLLEGGNRIRVARVEAHRAILDAASPLMIQSVEGDETATGLVLRRMPGKFMGGVEGPFAPIFTTGVRQVETASMSSPVLGTGSAFIGALTLSGPAFRLTAEVADKLAPALAGATANLSCVFGYNPEQPTTSKTTSRKATGSRQKPAPAVAK